MKESSLNKIAENYANAILQNLDKTSTGLTMLSYLDLVVRSMEKEKSLWNLFLSKMIDSSIRQEFIKEFFRNELVSRFFMVIELNSRWHLLPLILYCYDDLQLKNRGAVAGTLWVSRPISEAEEAKVLSTVENLVKSKVRMRIKEDASLIEGFRVKVGPWLIENSVSHKLKKIRSLVGDG